MNLIKKVILPIFVAAIWISISEFIRNTYFVHQYWIDHFQKLGIVFPEEPINGLVWGAWSLSLAIFIFIISKKFSLLHTTFLAWFAAFLMMWLVLGNLGILPIGILMLAIPLSLFEVLIATLIINTLTKKVPQNERIFR